MQAEQELLQDELDIQRLADTLARMQGQALVLKQPARATPFAFPLMVERFREKLTNESLADRIARMVQQLERSAGGAVAAAAGTPPVEEARGFTRGPTGAPRAARARRARPRPAE